jgi:hypothetical protein
MATLKLSPIKKSIPVEMDFGDGNVVLYSVKEFSGSQREAYFEKQAKKFVTDDKGQIKEVKDYKGMYSTLLAFTVHDADGKLVPEAVIQEWPDSVQKALVEASKDVCNMVEQEDPDADPKKT